MNSKEKMEFLLVLKVIFSASFISILIVSMMLTNISALAQEKSLPLTEEATQLYEQKQYRNALIKFAQAYQSNEDPPLNSFNQGVCYYRLGDQARAQQYFRFVIQNFPRTGAAQQAKSWLEDAKSWGRNVDTSRPSRPASSGSSGVSGIRAMGIPYSVDQQGLIIVGVLLNGKPIPVYFDTGAEGTMFTSSQLARAGIELKSTGGEKIRMSGIAGETQGRIQEVEIGIGPIVKRMQVAIQDDTSQIRNEGTSRQGIFRRDRRQT